MKPFTFTGIHHAAFATSDMDRTIEYWRDLLGFSIAVTFSNRDGRQYAFNLPGNMLIYFFEWSGVLPPAPKRHGVPVTGPFHFDHLALGLATDDDLFRLQDQLVACDLPVSDVIDHGYIHSIYTFDPNGIPLEFNCQTLRTNFEQHPVLADRDPATTVLQGHRPVPEKWPLAEPDDIERIIIRGEDWNIFHSE